ncbi:GNAT family N-acetyltransferase [Enterobacterales bacterium CwR94]|nr:GNAT family N-acetyltransferase [Enterobacterales bacterium CwR94]
MDVQIRPAIVADIPGLFHVRTSVTENKMTHAELAELGITEAAIVEMITADVCAWVAARGRDIIGFSMILPADGCLFAAFILPEAEGMGLGKRLVAAAEQALFTQHAMIWLETGKNTRAAGFYRHLGWENETDIGDGDIRLEKRRP